MSIGLDLGSTQFRSLRHHGDRLIGRTCCVQVLSVPDTPAHRRLLDRDGVHYADCAGTLNVLGDAAIEWARLMSLPARRLLADGQLPHDDPIARQILSMMVDAVLPMARIPGETCCLTIPGELLPVSSSPEREFFLRLVRLRGYTPKVAGQGHSLVLAELGEAGFSGLGISLGASLSEFSLCRSGREIARCSIPWGSDEIDERLARDPSENLSEISLTMAAVITDFLVELLLEAGTRIEQHDGFRVLSQPVTVACAGGITLLPGIQRMCEQAWRRAGWPIGLQKLTVCADSAYTIARGCLVQAVLESQAESVAIAA